MRIFVRVGGRCSVPKHGTFDTGDLLPLTDSEAVGFAEDPGWTETLPEPPAPVIEEDDDGAE